MNWDNKVKISIGNHEYSAYIVVSEDDKIQGLSNVLSIAPDEALLFDYSSNPQESLIFNTAEMEFPIDIIFINDDDEIVAVEYGEPHSKELIECVADPEEKLKYVLEVNANSEIKVGDELEFEDDTISDEDIDKMYILDSDGKPQMTLLGGERIFSRSNLRTLIKLSKRANKTKAEGDYAKLGRKMFKYLHTQDTQDSQYVEAPK